MKLLFNLLRLIHIVLPSSRQPNWRYGSVRLQQSCKRYGTWYGEGFNDWGGRGYNDFVPGEVTKTARSEDRIT